MNTLSKQQTSNIKGFTIVELMIATLVFSVVLLMCATAIMQVGRMYYKSTLLVRTMDTTRAVSDDVSQAIQFGVNSTSFYRVGAETTYDSVQVKSYCLGDIRYSYAPGGYSLGSAGHSGGQSQHILWKDRGANTVCTPQNITIAQPTTPGQELLGGDMRLPWFEIKPGTGVDTGIWDIKITVAYGSTNDLFTPGSDFKTCINSSVGGQFCAVSSINTNAIKRL